MNRIISSWGARVPLRINPRPSSGSLIGAACFDQFSTQSAVLFAQALLGGGCGVGFACCDGLVAPGAQSLGAAAQRLGHDPDGGRSWFALSGLAVEDHPHGAFAELKG